MFMMIITKVFAAQIELLKSGLSLKKNDLHKLLQNFLFWKFKIEDVEEEIKEEIDPEESAKKKHLDKKSEVENFRNHILKEFFIFDF